MKNFISKLMLLRNEVFITKKEWLYEIILITLTLLVALVSIGLLLSGIYFEDEKILRSGLILGLTSVSAMNIIVWRIDSRFIDYQDGIIDTLLNKVSENEEAISSLIQKEHSNNKVYYKNRLDLLDLPFLPEDFGFEENINDDNGIKRMYTGQGFTITRDLDNRWIIATPEGKTSHYKFLKAFDAYHTLKTLGYDHSKWEEIIKIEING